MPEEDPVTWRDFIFVGGVLCVPFGAILNDWRVAVVGIVIACVMTWLQVRAKARRDGLR